MEEILIGGYYRHYKGGLYKVIDRARHSEGLEWTIVYETLYPNDLARIWVRPEKMFLETVTIEGAPQPRFRLLGPQDWPAAFETFHAHVYYEAKDALKTETLHEKIVARKKNHPGTRASKIHRDLRGPHLLWMFTVEFEATDFIPLVHFLAENRDGLSIFMHPLSGSEILDHTRYALFLGEKQNLNLEIFGMRA